MKINVLDKGFVELVDQFQNDPSLKVVNSARISYNKKKSTFDSKDKGLTGFLWQEEHTSPFRHSYFTFHLKMPLIVARQWMKYQIGCAWREYSLNGSECSQKLAMEAFDLMFDEDKGCSWNEVSGRYVELQPEFYIPDRMRTNAGHGNRQQSSEPDYWNDEFHQKWKEQFNNQCILSYNLYQTALQAGIAKEIARGYLPQSTYTEAYWTCSLQSLLHFISQRTKETAQYEIREYALSIKQILQPTLDQLGIEL